MKKQVSKVLRSMGCVVLSAAMILGSACSAKETEESKKKKKKNKKETTVESTDTTDTDPTDTEPTETDPTDPTEPDIDPEASIKLHELDEKIFRHGLTDIISIEFELDHPENFGIDWPDVGITPWSESDADEAYAFAKEVLADLEEIDYNSLELEDRVLYETIQYDYQMSIDTYGMDYYTSSVNDLTGINAQLPILFATLEINDLDSAERYLIMLNDVKGYYESLLQYEQKRADLGYSYPDDIIDNIVASCEAVYEDHDGNYMFTTFEEKVNALDIDDATKADLIARNKDILENSFFPAYEELAEGMKAFKGTATTSGKLCEMPGGKEFYEYYFQVRSGTSMTPDEAADFLDDVIYDAFMEYYTIYTGLSDDQIKILEDMDAGQGPDYTTGSFESDLEFCMEAIKNDFPELPEHTYSVFHVPQELADFFSPAAYMTTQKDNPTHNTLMINDYCDGLSDLLTTVAHEAYPGHLLEAVYHISNLNNYYLMNGSTAYAEGWSTYCENYIMSLQDDFDYDTYRINYILMTQVLNYYMQARMDIGVHYEGWTWDDCKDYAAQYFGTAGGEIADFFYDRIIEIPCYVTPYCFGNIKCTSIINDAMDEYGDDYTKAEIHAAYLDIGCTTFDILEKYMDEFVEKQH